MKMARLLRPIAATVATLLFLASVALSQGAPNSPIMEQRTGVMIQADNAIRRLAAMATGRALFDREQAKHDRRILIRTTRAIPGLYRQKPNAPSRASQGIWLRWTEFRNRSKRATQAARNLNTRSPETLQSGMPDLVRACLGCHDQFRLKTHAK